MSYIKKQIQNEILHLTVCHIEDGNALSPEIAAQLSLLIDEYSKKCRGLIFSSEGERFFCSGGNLKQYAKLSAAEGLQANKMIRDVIGKLANFSQPTVAIVDGDCFGGGVELLSAFNYIISSPHSFFGLWQRRIALSFGWGGISRLSNTVSHHRLKELMLSARSFSAFEARSLGLVHLITPSTKHIECAQAWLTNQMNLPQKPLNVIKEEVFNDEVGVFEKLWFNSEHRKILSQFKKK